MHRARGRPAPRHALPRSRPAVLARREARRLQSPERRHAEGGGGVNLVTIAFKSIRQRALASSLTLLSVALGVMLMVTVLVIHSVIEDVFSQKSIGYDLIVGPKGSDIQLVLSTVFRVQPPIENLPY